MGEPNGKVEVPKETGEKDEGETKRGWVIAPHTLGRGAWVQGRAAVPSPGVVRSLDGMWSRESNPAVGAPTGAPERHPPRNLLIQGALSTPGCWCGAIRSGRRGLAERPATASREFI